MIQKNTYKNYYIAAYILMAIALFLTLQFHFVTLCFTATLSYIMLDNLNKNLKKLGHKLFNHNNKSEKMFQITSVTIIGGFLLLGLSVLGLWLAHFFSHENLLGFSTKINSILEVQKNNNLIPEFIFQYLPDNTQELKTQSLDFLKQNLGQIQTVGTQSVKFVVYVVIGFILGVLFLFEQNQIKKSKPFKDILSQRVILFKDSFEDVFLAQMKISFVNAILTAIYIYIVLPLFDVYLPFQHTIVVLTFLFGLLPVIGNLITNTIIVVLSLGISIHTAIASLIFLVIIHKLEYFLNAKIIGSHTKTKTWEILIVLFVFEHLYGISGMIVGTVFYSYLKKELEVNNLI